MTKPESVLGFSESKTVHERATKAHADRRFGRRPTCSFSSEKQIEFVGQLTSAGQVLIHLRQPSPIYFLSHFGSTPITGGTSVGEDTMKSFITKVQKFMKSEDGPTAVEYAIMLALIVIVCLTAIQAVGTAANSAFQNVTTQMNATGVGN